MSEMVETERRGQRNENEILLMIEISAAEGAFVAAFGFRIMTISISC